MITEENPLTRGGYRKMKTGQSAMTPGVAAFVAAGCPAFGVVALLGGILFAVFSIDSKAPDATRGFVIGVSMIAASFIWFAMACCVALLSQVAENTSKSL